MKRKESNNFTHSLRELQKRARSCVAALSLAMSDEEKHSFISKDTLHEILRVQWN